MRPGKMLMQALVAVLAFFTSCGAFAQPVAATFQYPLAEMPATSQRVGDWNADWRGNHLGLDLSVIGGTPVYAVADGILRFSEYVGQLGNAVHIQHTLPDGSEITSIYYHLRRQEDGGPSLAEYLGRTIPKGTLIGFVTSRDYDNGEGDHLHFGLRRGAYRIGHDPDTAHWYYAGYSAIGRTASDRNDPVHTRVTNEWEADPRGFIEARLGPSTSSTVSAASCSAPIVGQAMICSVIGTNLPASISATASNCSPNPMTVVAGGSGDRRQFSCSPVTVGEVVQVSYTVPNFIGPLPLIAPAVATPPSSDSQVVYSEPFAGDPGWQTDQPGSFRWNAATGTYLSRTITGDPLAVAPYSSATVRLPSFNPNRGFTLSWDQKLDAVSENARVYFALFSDPLAIGTRNTIGFLNGRSNGNAVEYWTLNFATATGIDFGFGRAGGGGESSFLMRSQLWYRITITYNPATTEMRFLVADRSSGLTVYSRVAVVPGSNIFASEMQYLGIVNIPMGERSVFALTPNGYIDTEFDNILLTYTTQPAYTLALSISPVIVPIGGSATLSWDSGGAPLSSCSLTRSAIPLTLTGTTGSMVITNIQGRTTFTLTCGASSVTRTLEVVPSAGGT